MDIYAILLLILCLFVFSYGYDDDDDNYYYYYYYYEEEVYDTVPGDCSYSMPCWMCVTEFCYHCCH